MSDVRSVVEKSLENFDDEAPEEAAEQPEPVEASPEEEAHAEQPELEETPEDQREESAEAKADRARDDAGRFTKAQKEKAAAAAKVATSAAPDPKAATTTPAVAEKAPQSWSPAAREKWSATPPEVRAQIAKREREITTALNESAPARKFHSDFREAIAPYAPMLGNAEPLPVVRSLLQTAHQLAYAPPAHKAAMLAHLVTSYNVPIEELAAALDGKAAAPGAPARGAQGPGAIRDPRVDEILARDQLREKQRNDALMAGAKAKLEEFAKKHEFFEDVRLKMAHLHEAMTKDGLKPTPEELYALACQATPEVAAILKQRGPTPQANAKASTQQARNAASSIRGNPAPVAKSGQPDDVRSTVAAALNGDL